MIRKLRFVLEKSVFVKKPDFLIKTGKRRKLDVAFKNEKMTFLHNYSDFFSEKLKNERGANKIC